MKQLTMIRGPRSGWGGIPPGGDTGQILAKSSDDDGDVEWAGIGITEAEEAAGVTPINYFYEPGDARRYGYVADDSTDNTSSIQAAIDVASQTASVVAKIPGGIGRFGSTVTLASGVAVVGIGTEATILKYTGSGRAFYQSTPGTRIFDLRLENFGLYNTGTGSIGIELDSVSTSDFRNLWIDGFSLIGIRVYSPTSGYSVYNRFWNVTANRCATGFQLDGTSSNANVFVGCRANHSTTSGTRGWDISNSNGNQIIACHPEGVGIAIYIDASSPSLSRANQVAFNRIELCTTAIQVASSNVEDTVIVGNQYNTNTNNVIDSGTRTMVFDQVAERGLVFTTFQPANANGNVYFERTTEGGSSLPFIVLRDSASSGGTPITLQVETERSAGSFFRGRRGGNTLYDVLATGNVSILTTGILRAVGSGSPESSLTAPVGSTYQRTDGGASSSFYVKESGTGNTGWIAK